MSSTIEDVKAGRVELVSTEEIRDRVASTPTESILGKAHRAVFGDRSRYGKPLDNHGATGEMFQAFLRRKYGIDVPISAEDVCFFNILQKVSREANEEHEDSLVDIAGYSLNIELVRAEKAHRERRESDSPGR